MINFLRPCALAPLRLGWIEVRRFLRVKIEMIRRLFIEKGSKRDTPNPRPLPP
jgi:hypothetical protein